MPAPEDQPGRGISICLGHSSTQGDPIHLSPPFMHIHSIQSSCPAQLSYPCVSSSLAWKGQARSASTLWLLVDYFRGPVHMTCCNPGKQPQDLLTHCVMTGEQPPLSSDTQCPGQISNMTLNFEMNALSLRGHKGKKK